MPHTPATHITITPEHVYINGKPISVMEGTLELSTPSTVELQTVTLTIIPTSVTILNDDNPDTVNEARDTLARYTRDNRNRERQPYCQADYAIETFDEWKRREAERPKRTWWRNN